MKIGLLAELGTILRLTAPPRRMLAMIVMLGLITAALEGVSLLLFIPLLQSLGASSRRAGALEQSFEKVFGGMSQPQTILLLIALLLLTVALKNGFNLLGVWATRRLEGKSAHRLRRRIFDQTLSSCMDYRAEGRQADILTVLSDHSWKAASALSLVVRLAISLCTLIVFVGLMTLISVKLVMIAAASMAACALIIQRATRAASDTGLEVVAHNKNFGQRMLESIQSLQLIRAFGREDYEAARFEVASERMRRKLLKLDLFWAVPGPISEICIALLIGALILSAQWAGIGLAAVAAFLSLLYRSQAPIKELSQSRVWMEGMRGAIQDVADYLKASERPFLAPGHLTPLPLREKIEVRNVSFRYGPDEPWALRNVSFDIPVGRTTAIIGPSGAGKSSLMSLLCRFYDPSEGAILADGQSIREFQLSGWRQRLALMSQDVQLFNDTVEANIGYGDLEAGADDIRRAAQVANADEFIQKFPKGYMTVVGDGGLRLSGGQRQRIALARTILRNPDVLFLDEATNSLDIEAERAFQLALEQYAHKRTVVVIAHRLTTVQHADQVVVIENGRVLEVGSPAELLEGNGHFARLYNLYVSGHPAAQPDVVDGV